MPVLGIVLISLVIVVAVLRLMLTANRLDRLHVRTEAAWGALEGALSRRIVATRSAAAAGAFPGPETEEVRRLTTVADQSDRAQRADAENDLSRLLNRLPPVHEPALAAELADAAERMALARSFYNDAVRDTRSLRAVPFTRFFRLAGSAVLPHYFELVEVDRARSADPSAGPAPGDRAASVLRTAARVVMTDPAGRVLLFCTHESESGPVWFTPGGGVEEGENLTQAAIRELVEETGLRLTAADLSDPVWRRRAQFAFAGTAYDQIEFYLAAAVPEFEVNTAGFTPLERAGIAGHRWFSADELRNTPDIVYPAELASRLSEISAALRTPRAVLVSDIR